MFLLYFSIGTQKRYKSTVRNLRTAVERLGKKKVKNGNDDVLGQLYLTACCTADTIKTFFSFNVFAAKRKAYSLLPNERDKSFFIDRLIDSAVHLSSENINYSLLTG